MSNKVLLVVCVLIAIGVVFAVAQMQDGSPEALGPKPETPVSDAPTDKPTPPLTEDLAAMPAWKAVETFNRTVEGQTPRAGSQERERAWKVVRVPQGPVVDGTEEPLWSKAEDFYVWDAVAKLNIRMKAVHDGEQIYFLVSFTDSDESRQHKNWHWDTKESIYKLDAAREDTFVFKWNLEEKPVDLSVHADNPYHADIWFWKACRTDPEGYADDKHQILQVKEDRKAKRMQTRSGKVMYLLRKGDKGKSSYMNTAVPVEHADDVMSSLTTRKPEGSRADIRAKGSWRDGLWTIEFSRRLKTGNEDDIQLDLSKEYLLGVSRFEIAGRVPNTGLAQPLFGSGDVYNVIHLTFER